MYDTQANVTEGRGVQVGEENSLLKEDYRHCAGGTAPKAAKGKTVIIYVLLCPITGYIRYVGKTVLKLYRRLCQHYQGKKNRYKDCWVASLRSQGLKPIIAEIDRIENSDDTDWQELERFYITYFRFLGFPLTNLDAGGTGGNLKSEETKKKIGDAHRGRVHSEESRKNFRESHLGKKLTPEQCANMSKAIKGKKLGPRPPEVLKKISKALKGKKRKRTPEHQAKLAATQVGRKRSEETRAKISAAQKGKKRGPYSPERVAKAVSGMTEEARKRMSIGSLQRWGRLPLINLKPINSHEHTISI